MSPPSLPATILLLIYGMPLLMHTAYRPLAERLLTMVLLTNANGASASISTNRADAPLSPALSFSTHVLLTTVRFTPSMLVAALLTACR